MSHSSCCGGSCVFFFQAEDGIRDLTVTGVQTCALPILPGTYQKPAPYRLQTFTYSTGLAFTGRSAACAPATATRPAAEPRRRLFTIFILNLQLTCPWEGSVRVRLHPGRSPD